MHHTPNTQFVKFFYALKRMIKGVLDHLPFGRVA